MLTLRGDNMPIEVKEILKCLNDASYEAYLVGGYPRDRYRGGTTDDFDICTNATPEELKKLFPQLGEVCFGSCRLKKGKVEVQITPYREEYEYRNHRFVQKYRYVDTLKQDLKRRDFVMNTLCMDADEHYVDLLDARKDIDNKMIRCVGDPFQKLEEDVLRILRAVRFATTLHFDIDTSLKDAIIAKRNLLKILSKDRIKIELDRILKDPIGLDWICKLKLEMPLELGNISDVKWVDDIDFCWAQMNYKAYPMCRSRMKRIKAICRLLQRDLNEPMILYQTQDAWLKKLAVIKNISYEILKDKKEALPIHKIEDIAVSITHLKAVYEKYPVQFVYQCWKELEIQIVLGNIENNETSIYEFMDQIIDRKFSTHQKKNRV